MQTIALCVVGGKTLERDEALLNNASRFSLEALCNGGTTNSPRPG